VRYPIAAFLVEALPDFRGIPERSVSPATDGAYPQLNLIVPKKGVVMLGFLSCATCHTRIQPGGSVVEGGQGTVPDLPLSYPPDVQSARAFARALFRVPWVENDPADRIQNMSLDEINAAKAAMPPGVVGRHETGLFSPCRFPT
jgi:hypothetical protein